MTALYRFLLRCYPRTFRLRFGDELAAAFDEGLRASRMRGPVPAVRFAITRLADAVASGLAERFSERGLGRARPHTPGPEERGRWWMQDLRFAVRMMRRRPAFAAVVITTLALGIGATTTVFSVIDAVLLRPLPYPHADRLVHVETRNDALQVSGGPASYPDFLDWRAAGLFEDVGIFQMGNAVVRFGDTAERVRSAAASASLFSTLGVQPVIGRLPTPDEDRPGARPVVLLTGDLWRRRFGGDPGILDRAVTIDGRSLAVVGVLPDRFTFQGDPKLWTTLDDDSDLTIRANRYLKVIGRVRPGTPAVQVDERLTVLCARLDRAYPDSNKDWRATVVPLQESQVSDVRPQLVLLSGSVGLVLLISCTNVAMLLLVRGTTRTRELAVRAALGAGGWRLVSQLLTESVVWSLAGGAAGLVIGAEACLHSKELDEALDQQRRRDDQEERDRGLGDEERLAEQAAAPTRRGRAARVLEQGVDVGPGRLQRGSDADQHAGQARRGQGEHQDPPVHGGLGQAGNVLRAEAREQGDPPDRQPICSPSTCPCRRRSSLPTASISATASGSTSPRWSAASRRGRTSSPRLPRWSSPSLVAAIACGRASRSPPPGHRQGQDAGCRQPGHAALLHGDADARTPRPRADGPRRRNLDAGGGRQRAVRAHVPPRNGTRWAGTSASRTRRVRGRSSASSAT